MLVVILVLESKVLFSLGSGKELKGSLENINSGVNYLTSPIKIGFIFTPAVVSLDDM